MHTEDPAKDSQNTDKTAQEPYKHVSEIRAEQRAAMQQATKDHIAALIECRAAAEMPMQVRVRLTEHRLDVLEKAVMHLLKLHDKG